VDKKNSVDVILSRLNRKKVRLCSTMTLVVQPPLRLMCSASHCCPNRRPARLKTQSGTGNRWDLPIQAIQNGWMEQNEHA
jgi:hypothetical protein